MTAAQRGIWFAQTLAPGGNAFWISEYLDIQGSIDAPRLEDAVRQAFGEAEQLRAVFRTSPDGPVQRFQPLASDWHLPIIDFSDRREPVAAALAWMKDDCAAPSDFRGDGSEALDVGELFKPGLLKIAAERFFYHQRYHHIVADGFAAMLFATRVAALYTKAFDPDALVRVGSQPLRPVNEVLSADRRYDGSPGEAEDRAFWHQAMAGWEGPVRLAGPAAAPRRQSLVHRVGLDAMSLQQLADLPAAHGLSPADLMLALVATWVNALTGVTDLVLAFALTARPPAAKSTLVPTMMSNVLPIRLEVRRGGTVIDLARNAKAFRQRSREHGRYRGERLLRELTHGRESSFGPTLNIMSFRYDLRFGGLKAVTHNVSIGPVDDICVTIYDRKDGEGLDIILNANPDLYAQAQVEALSARFEALIRTVLETPDLPLEQLDLLDAGERARLLVGRNETARDLPVASLWTLFAAGAAADPDAPCLWADDQAQTYGEVETAARRVAGHLLQRGVERGDIVGILLPRSSETLIAALAVSMAGAAFLMMDPTLPAARIGVMIAEAQPVVLATRRAAVAEPPAGVSTVWLEDLPPDVAGPAPADMATPGREDLAYVIFTSGTTGHPKAVGIANRGLASLAASLAETLGAERQSRVLQFSALSFDALILELCLAFAVGASLYLPREEERYGPALGRFLDRHRISHALLPPTALTGLNPAHQAYPTTLIVGGEPCPATVAKAWSRERLLVNAYGPAEATVCATLYRRLSGEGPPPIGSPILNTRVYVLDGFGRLLPDGVAGELYIAGDGVGVGYLGRPDLTAERFLPCPFEPGGARMYRTGDRVRWNADGTLAYLGRMDRQIKLRGVRVEPAGIEAALSGLQGVKSAFVQAAGEGQGRSLVAYAVPEPDAALDPDNLRRHLAALLPAHLLPSAIMILSELPVTVNGKVDTAALPQPATVPSGAASPETPTEVTLAPLFATALGREDIGVDDNFFALGGDSLKATLLIVKIGEALAVDLTIASIFKSPTVRTLAQALDAEKTTDSPAATAVLLTLQDGDKPGLYCIHPGPGLGWPYAALIRYLPPDQPLYAVQARGLDGIETVPDSLDAMAADYAAQIVAHQPRGPYHILGWSSGGPIAHAVATALQAEGREIGLLASIDGYPASPFYGASTPSGANPAAESEMLRSTIARFLAAAHNGDGPPPPVVDDRLLAAMLAVFTNTGNLLARARSGVFEGGLLLFKSTDPYDVPLPDPETWRSHITGALETVPVSGHHDAMLLPGPVGEIGPVLAEHLKAWEDAPAAKPLSILMTNLVLAERTGTEIMTAELARALLARGHRVAIYTPEIGPLADETRARGVAVTDRIDRLAFVPDIIHGHHNAPTAVAMIRFKDTPALTVCHDSSYWFDVPIVCDRIGAYVAIDGACVDRLVVAGVDESRITAIPNGVDIGRFPLREHWSDQPRTALAIVKGNAPHLERLQEACRLENLPLEVVGRQAGRVVDNLSEFCARADIVLAHSRSAMEAAATGAAVIICDEYGFGGLLTEQQIAAWPNTRLAHRSLDDPLTVDAVRAAIRAYRPDQAERAARLLRETVSWQTVARAYERLYGEVVAKHETAVRQPDDGPLAAFIAGILPTRSGRVGRAALEDGAEQRWRELDSWLALHAPEAGANAEISFNSEAIGRLLLGDGWYAPENWCVWSGDAPALLKLPRVLMERANGDLTLRCAYHFSHRGPEDEIKHVDVLANGRPIAQLAFDRRRCQHNAIVTRDLTIPPALVQGTGALELAFRSLHTSSPFEAGDGPDTRQLGLALVSIAPRAA